MQYLCVKLGGGWMMGRGFMSQVVSEWYMMEVWGLMAMVVGLELEGSQSVELFRLRVDQTMLPANDPNRIRTVLHYLERISTSLLALARDRWSLMRWGETPIRISYTTDTLR